MNYFILSGSPCLVRMCAVPSDTWKEAITQKHHWYTDLNRPMLPSRYTPNHEEHLFFEQWVDDVRWHMCIERVYVQQVDSREYEIETQLLHDNEA